MTTHARVNLHVKRLRQQLADWTFDDGLSSECAREARRFVEARIQALEMAVGVDRPDTLKLETAVVLDFVDPRVHDDVAECVEGPARRLLAFAAAKKVPARGEFGGAPLLARPVDEVGWVVGRWITTCIERGIW